MTYGKIAQPTKTSPCTACPWRLANQGRRHPGGFYTVKNLTRLWGQIRRGGGIQTCHPTDPSHPDHGAKEGSVPQECLGSVILVLREVEAMTENIAGVRTITNAACTRYLARPDAKKRGLTKTGVMFWVIQRIQLANATFVGEPPIPEVDRIDKEVDLPSSLRAR